MFSSSYLYQHRRLIQGNGNIDAVAALTVGGLRSVVFSPKNKNVILCLRRNPQEVPICRLDLDTGKAVTIQPNFNLFDTISGQQHEAIAFSPDGSSLISCLPDGKIYIYDSETGKPVTPPFYAEENAVSFHSATLSLGNNGGMLLIARRVRSDPGTVVYVWNIITRQALASPISLGGKPDSIALSPDHTHIIYLRCNRIHRIGLTDNWEAAEFILEGHKSLVCYLEFSPDGTRVISGAHDGTIIISDAVTGKNIGEPLLGHVAKITNITFSPDGARMASAADDYTIYLWDLKTGRALVAPLRGHTDMFISIAFSADGQDLLSSARDKTARVWDVIVQPTPPIAPEIKFSFQACHALRDARTLFQDFDDVNGDWRDAVEVRQDGWIVGPQGRLLLHVPTMHLPGLVRVRTKRLILVDAAELDLSNLAHGPSWQACRRGGGLGL